MSTHEAPRLDAAGGTVGRRRRVTGDAAAPQPLGRGPGLTLVVVVGAAVAALAGLLLEGVYASGRHGTGAEATTQMLRGYDLVTLVVALPLLLWAVTGARRTTTTAQLLATACLAYLGYTYVYYVLGNGFTDLLLLHVAVLSGSIAALIRALSGLGSRVTSVSRRAQRSAAVVLGTLATALGVMWVFVCLAYTATGELPEGSLLVETAPVVQLGIVLDLAVLVPWYGAAAVLLWLGRWWGVVLGVIALVAGLMHQLSYLAALLFQELAGVPGAVGFDPLEPVIVSLYVVGAVLLLRATRRGEAAATARRSVT